MNITDFNKILLDETKKIHFSGVCGSGMRGLAILAKSMGMMVSGSDRLIDENRSNLVVEKILKSDLRIVPQNGSGVTEDTDAVIFSTAVEDNNADILTAKNKNIRLIHRSDLLASIFNDCYGIAVGGTSGKSTTSAIIVHVLKECGINVSYCLGGEIIDYEPFGSVGFVNGSKYFCIEADESDRTIKKYEQKIGVITNISAEHLELEELMELFKGFAQKCSEVVYMGTDNEFVKNIYLSEKNKIKAVTFGTNFDSDHKISNIVHKGFSSSFTLDGFSFLLNIPGLHNIYNSCVAILIAKRLGADNEAIKKALANFKGVRRRFQIKGEVKNITVVDDFAHNPEKAAATLEFARKLNRRLIIMYQPHGYLPALKHRAGFLEVWKKYLNNDDILIYSDIFYPGGTIPDIAKDLTSKDLSDDAVRAGLNSHYIKTREETADFIVRKSVSNDLVIVMGARDDSLSDFCETILIKL